MRNQSFKNQMYNHLLAWKRKYLSQEQNDELHLSERNIYPDIVSEIEAHQSQYKFKWHIQSFHIASSQIANLNLFLPILLHPQANEVLQQIKTDFQTLATNQLYKGFRIEFWDGNSTTEKGLLGDHNAAAGTDADLAIAYYNKKEELCLWMIEHKLTEKEFTACGGAKSNGKTEIHNCDKTFLEILENKETCYYHSNKNYEYWNISETHQAFFINNNTHQTCPFKEGMNQLWRNQLLALSLEKQGIYKHVYFSVVKHPQNNYLDTTLKNYQDLIQNNPKFSIFNSNDFIKAAKSVNSLELDIWIDWYRTLYNV